MCIPGIDPLTIAALAASAAGSAITGYEANKSQNSMIEARNAATQAELARQKQFQEQSNQIFNATLDRFQPETQAQDLTTQQATSTNAFTGNTPTATDVGSIATTNAPRVVQEAGEKSVGKVFARAGKRNAAAGNLTGYGQQGLENNVTLGRSGQKIGTVSDFARTSAGVSGLEQNTAYKNAYKPPSGIGDIFSTIGTVGAYGGGKGWFTPAGATGPAPGGGRVALRPDMMYG